MAYQKKVRAVANDYRVMVENIFNDGVKKKQFVELDPVITCFALFGMGNWAAFWYRKNGPVTLEKIAEIFSRIFLMVYGLRLTTVNRLKTKKKLS